MENGLYCGFKKVFLLRPAGFAGKNPVLLRIMATLHPGIAVDEENVYPAVTRAFRIISRWTKRSPSANQRTAPEPYPSPEKALRQWEGFLVQFFAGSSAFPVIPSSSKKG